MASTIPIPDPSAFHPPEIAVALVAVARAARADIEALQASGGGGEPDGVAFHEQAMPAALANAPMIGGTPTRRAGTVVEVALISAEAAAQGETMTIDVGLDGESILTGVFTLRAQTPANARVPLPVRPGVRIAVGDRLTVSRGYTPGASPRLAATTVEVLWR
jgi:hypothetical protein